MNLERYAYDRKRTYKEYVFYSNGPNGRVLKVVRFVLLKTRPVHIYNLTLGDWNKAYDELDYWSVTNNGDTGKVLATVAAIVYDFMDIFRSALILVESDSPARIRLYQMAIHKYLKEIEEIFNVYGDIDDDLVLFQKNVHYNAFLITRKEYVILKEPNEIYMTSSTKNNQIKKHVYNDRDIDGLPLIDENHPEVIKKTEAAMKTLDRIMPKLEAILRKDGYL